MVSIWICQLCHANYVFHILGESGLVGQDDHLRPIYLETRLVAQESVALFKCHILGNMTFWPQMLYYRGFSRNWPF